MVTKHTDLRERVKSLTQARVGNFVVKHGLVIYS